MILQLTDFAVSVLASNPSPTLDVFKIGSGYNFVPSPTDTNIRGELRFEGLVSSPTVLNANVVRYTMAMDSSVGDFEWGEVGIFYQNQLFALAVSNVPQMKLKVGATPGNQVRLDAYLTIVGTNYNMIVDEADSSNQFQMASLSTVDQLPPSNQSGPNAYVITGADANQSAFFAYTDRLGLWNFDTYQLAGGMRATVSGAAVKSVTIPAGEYLPDMAPTYFGETLVEFTTGKLYSVCRYIKAATVSGSAVTLEFDTPMAMLPVAGDKITIYKRSAESTRIQIPVATTSELGGIIIGSGLLVLPDGTCSVDPAALGLVKSVNTKTPDVNGAITLVAADIGGLSTVATTGKYSDLIGLPAPYVLPPISLNVRGGARLPQNGNLVATGDVIDLGFAPIKTVNNVAPDAGGNVTVNTNYTLPAATATVRGGIRVGNGLTITGDVLSYVLPFASTNVLGGVKQGTGVTIAADGTISSSYNLPTASPTTLGGVRVGAGLTINGSGLLSATVQTVNGASPDINGNVIVPPDDAKLNRVQGVATALRYTDIYVGLRTPTTGFPIDVGLANSMAALFDSSSAGTINWTFTGWPSSGYTEVQVELTNAGLATHNFPATVKFVLPDGTFTTSYAGVLTAQRGTTNFQTSGKDFLCFWSRNGGTDIYCKVM